MLLKLAKDKTEQLYLSTFPSTLPNVHKGIRITKAKASSERPGFASILR